MTLHLLKVVWRRKGANALVIAEIFFSFLVVFGVATLGVSTALRWNAPLGFSWENVWVVDVDASLPEEHSGTRTQIDPDEERRRTEASQRNFAEVDHLMKELRGFPQVESVAADAMTPYSDRIWQTALGPDARNAMLTADRVTDDFARVMRVPVIRGRWFSAEDDGQNYDPIVIDTDAAKALFGAADPIGQTVAARGGIGGPVNRPARVVGVIRPFRESGELSGNDIRMIFFRTALGHAEAPDTNQILVRVRPGTPRSFEAELNRRLHPSSSAVTFRIRTMSEMRRTSIRMRVIPLTILGTVALFLISMVALGLSGVLWQTVTRRMRELGLRRALGATAGSVRRQVLVEVALLATLAVAGGTFLVAQLPLLGFLRIVSATEFATGVAAALVTIYAIVLLCGAYPSWLASRIDPAEALRYE